MDEERKEDQEKGKVKEKEEEKETRRKRTSRVKEKQEEGEDYYLTAVWYPTAARSATPMSACIQNLSTCAG